MIRQERPSRGTFIVQIVNSRNKTWHGTVKWVEKKKSIPFRSTLELIKLIDSALTETELECTRVNEIKELAYVHKT